MLSKPLEQIQRSDLLALIDAQVSESKLIEYKQELPDSRDGGPVKILRALTSFANTNGGHVLYGVEAKEGVAVALPGIDSSNEDEIKQRIENLCREGVQPRLLNARFRFVGVSEKRSVLIIEVQKSWAAPHRVTLGGHDKFYGRNAIGAYPLDVDELRTAFTLSHAVAERARGFCRERLTGILAGDTPVPCAKAGKLVLHIMPMSAFTESALRALPDADNRSTFGPVGWSSGTRRLNLDGLISSSAYPPQESASYTQLYRSGIVESVLAFERHTRNDGRDGGLWLPAHWYEPQIIRSVKEYVAGLEKLGAGPPYFVWINFLAVRDYKLSGEGWMRNEHITYERDHMHLPEAVLQASQDIIAALRPLFDMVWNAYGYEGSLNFNEAGELIVSRK